MPLKEKDKDKEKDKETGKDKDKDKEKGPTRSGAMVRPSVIQRAEP